MRARRSTWLAGLVLAGLISAGCLGPSNATGRLFKWNNELDGKWGNEVAFIVLLPVYAVFSLGDLVIFNSYYWWSGDHLVDPPQVEVPTEFGI